MPCALTIESITESIAKELADYGYHEDQLGKLADAAIVEASRVSQKLGVDLSSDYEFRSLFARASGEALAQSLPLLSRHFSGISGLKAYIYCEVHRRNGGMS